MWSLPTCKDVWLFAPSVVRQSCHHVNMPLACMLQVQGYNERLSTTVMFIANYGTCEFKFDGAFLVEYTGVRYELYVSKIGR